MLRSTVRSAAVAAAIAGLAVAAGADQAFPNKPLRMVVPFSAGGSTDVIARQVAQGMSKALGQTIIVENKDGASGAIATQFVAGSPPDGYTLCYCTTGSLVILPLIDSRLPYKPDRDLVAVTHAVDQPFGVVVRSSLGVDNLKELVAYAKDHPRKLTFGSPGTATPSHLTGELLNIATGMDMQHIPYRGDAPAVQDMLGGQIDAMMLSAVSVKQLVGTGKVKVLAVTSARRLPSLPDTPTVAELGYPGFQTNNMQSVIAPAKTPPEVMARLNAAAVAALHAPETVEKVASQGLLIVADSPASATQNLKDELARWAPVVEKLQLKR